MKLNRAAFIQHLQKIACNGQIEGAVFTGAFEAAALKEDHLLLVIAPALPKVAPLPGPVGVGDLGFFIRALGFLSGQGNDATNLQLTVEEHRIVVDEDERGSQYLLTAHPKTIGTAIAEGTVAKFLGKAPKGKGVPITQALITGVKTIFSGYKAEEVELHLEKKGGKVTVGSQSSNYAEFPVPELKVTGKEKPYTLLFGKHLVDVLSGISNFDAANILFGGPESFVIIEDGPYKYILSPRSRGAEGTSPEAEGGGGE